MAKRTMENCNLIKEHGKPETDGGKCIGMGTEKGDEPCEICKRCNLNSTYGEDVYDKTY